MVRAWLHDDPDTARWADRPMEPVTVKLDEDLRFVDGTCPDQGWASAEDVAPYGGGDASVTGQYTFTVRQRSRTGYDESGNPTYSWADVATAATGILYEERTEFDAVAGLTLVKARLVMLYDGPVSIHETATVTRSDGTRYVVTGSKMLPGQAELLMERVDQ